MLYTFLLTLAVVLWGCGGSSDDDSTVVTVSLTASPETVNAPAAGGTYTISVNTTDRSGELMLKVTSSATLPRTRPAGRAR